MRTVLRADFPVAAFAESFLSGKIDTRHEECSELSSHPALSARGRGFSAPSGRLLEAGADLVTMAQLLLHTTSMRDAMATKKGTFPAQPKQGLGSGLLAGLEGSGVAEFLGAVASVRSVALSWLGSEETLEELRPTSEAFLRTLCQFLFLEKPDWCSFPSLLVRVVAEWSGL